MLIEYICRIKQNGGKNTQKEEETNEKERKEGKKIYDKILVECLKSNVIYGSWCIRIIHIYSIVRLKVRFEYDPCDMIGSFVIISSAIRYEYGIPWNLMPKQKTKLSVQATNSCVWMTPMNEKQVKNVFGFFFSLSLSSFFSFNLFILCHFIGMM